MLRKFIITFTFILFLSSFTYAQDAREIELTLDQNIQKLFFSGNSPSLGARMWVPVSDRVTVIGELEYSKALPIFLNPTNDQMTASGDMWVYLTSRVDGKSNARPFVFGGLTQNMIIGVAGDPTNGRGGFGIDFSTKGGNHIIPTFEYETESFAGSIKLGQAYKAKVHFRFLLGKEFGASVAPYFSREDKSTPGFYTSRAGVELTLRRLF